jgi:hypothetical protein
MKLNGCLFLVVLFSLLFCGAAAAQKMPKEFWFTLRFGYHAKDATVFDSKKKTLIVQGLDTVMTFKLKLTRQEKKTIYNELQKINFIEYPEKYIYQHADTSKTYINSPCRHYFLTVNLNSKLKNVEWDNCIQSSEKDERHAALITLGKVIEKIIWAGNPLKDHRLSRVLIDPN